MATQAQASTSGNQAPPIHDQCEILDTGTWKPIETPTARMSWSPKQTRARIPGNRKADMRSTRTAPSPARRLSPICPAKSIRRAEVGRPVGRNGVSRRDEQKRRFLGEGRPAWLRSPRRSTRGQMVHRRRASIDRHEQRDQADHRRLATAAPRQQIATSGAIGSTTTTGDRRRGAAVRREPCAVWSAGGRHAGVSTCRTAASAGHGGGSWIGAPRGGRVVTVGALTVLG